MKLNFLTYLMCLFIGMNFLFGCAQISAPTGGAIDSLPPQLIKAIPEPNMVNFSGNKITLNFNEYIEVTDLQNNLLVSPLPKNNPAVTFNLKSINIKLKDSLKPNTTYTINFGNSIKDIHEGKVLQNFSYSFSSGPQIDSLRLSGRVLLAETGQPDSTIIIVLHRNTNDTAILSLRPDYLTKSDGQGNFLFENLPATSFSIFALKDQDGSKTYNASAETFAFADSLVFPTTEPESILLIAYAEKPFVIQSTTIQKSTNDKKLRYSTNLQLNRQDLLEPLEIVFNNKIQDFDTSRILLTDSNYFTIKPYQLSIDSSRKKIQFIPKDWNPDQTYLLIIPADAVSDSLGNKLTKSDSIRFNTKKESDYGMVTLRFKNLDLTKHPVLQILKSNQLIKAIPLNAAEWISKRFIPGDYQLRILYDNNQNGKWDPGHFPTKKQPEIAVTLKQTLSVRADWENELDLIL